VLEHDSAAALAVSLAEQAESHLDTLDVVLGCLGQLGCRERR
jgi:hypothetical protein